MKKYLLIISALILMLAPSVAHAQSTGLAVSPPTFDFTSAPGETIKNLVKVENITDRPITVKARAENFTAKGIDGQVELTGEDRVFGISSWVSFVSDTATIEPKSSAVFQYSVQIPESADPGSHYGALLFSTDATKSDTATQVLQEVGSLILIKIPGDVKEEASLVSFDPLEPTVTDGKAVFDIIIENKGTVHIKPSGTIDMQGLLSNRATTEVSGRNILPGSKRKLTATVDVSGFGPQTAKLTLVYGDGKKLEGTAQIFVLNTQQVIRYAIVIVILIVAYLLLQKRLRRAMRAFTR